MPTPLSIIYDGQCGFCIRSLVIVRKLDLWGALSFYDSHWPETLARFPELRNANLADAMYTIASGESAYRGFHSFRRLLWASPLLWILLPVFYFPGVSFIGERAYAWIASHRKNLGCGSAYCDLGVARSDGQLHRQE